MRDRNFEAFAACVALPYEVSTFEGQERIETRDMLSRVFHNVLAFYDEVGVTDMIRRPLSAIFRDDVTISALYETQLVHFGTVLRREPYQVHCEIIHVDDAWRVSNGRYAISDDAAHNGALVNTQ